MSPSAPPAPAGAASAPIAAPHPDDADAPRLEALHALVPRVPEAPLQHPWLRGLLKETAHMLGLPTALIALVLPDRHVVLAGHGLPDWLATGGSRHPDVVPCGRVVAEDRAWVIEDMAADPALAALPLAVEHGVRSYIGAPLRAAAAEGAVGDVPVGTLCAFGPVPMRFAAGHAAALQLLADEVVRLLAEQRLGA